MPNTAKTTKKSKSKSLKIFLAIVVAVIAGVFAWRAYNSSKTPAEPLSRRVILVGVDYIKENKAPPTQAALEYAYLATTYNQGLQKDGQSAGLEAAEQMLNVMYPAKQSTTQKRIQVLRKEYKLGDITASQSAVARGVIVDYQQRWATDGHSKVWKGTIPVGADKWRKVTDKGPFTPLAGSWKRWAVNKVISVPPPPVYGSLQDKQELANVVRVSARRTGEDVNKINFWGGTPGTEGPSGIWQKQLYNTIVKELPSNHLASDKTYATIQQNLAQTLSDAFMECWKVKYTYWTARPDMRDHSIKTAMPDPPFPSYISGHSTISKAAADVLSVMVPRHAQDWEDMAKEARDSRLVAGIHFNIDNVVGFQVGTKVGKQMIANLNLSKEL